MLLDSHRLGIGTATPGTKLEIVNTSNGGVSVKEVDGVTTAFNNTPALALQNSNATNNNMSEIGFFSSNGTVASALTGINTSHVNNYGDLAIFTRGSGGFGERMRIDSTGNVGIGTASPGQPLDVRSVQGSGNLQLRLGTTWGTSSTLAAET